MDKYNQLVKLEKLKDYRYKSEKNIIDCDNLDNITCEDRKKLLLDCLSDNEIKMHLLKYELVNKTFDEISNELSLSEFEVKAINLIEKFHWKAGGWKIEDSEFIIHKSDSKVYDVLQNEILFENTIDRSDLNDEENEFYLNHLIRHLNSLCNNINVEWNFKGTKNKTARLLIWCTDANMSVKSNYDSEEVGL